ncbi:hypothetical protein PybrP1_010863 [[Pythium] brassicae (nom. inval.)]|nr:hypothetical protein PybrP1_010863 [[Pythium] brassicae (nom. inval.)]
MADARPVPRPRRAPTRPLYHAEQVMEARRLPKKKYLATQRLRRDLERSSAESLALDVNSLRQEIVSLRTVREIVAAQRLTASASASPVGVVAQFIAALSEGVTGAPSEQLRFVRAALDPDVRFGRAAHGRDAFVQQCVAYTRVHARFRIDPPVLRELLPSASESALPVVVATSNIRVRLSRRTFEVLFPHALADEPLVQELIGREVAYPCESRVLFNSAHRIARYDAEVDFIAGLNDVVRSLRKVTELMDHARLDGCLIVLDGHADLVHIEGDREDGSDLEEAAAAVAAAYGPDTSSRSVATRMSIGMLLS